MPINQQHMKFSCDASAAELLHEQQVKRPCLQSEKGCKGRADNSFCQSHPAIVSTAEWFEGCEVFKGRHISHKLKQWKINKKHFYTLYIL